MTLDAASQHRSRVVFLSFDTDRIRSRRRTIRSGETEEVNVSMRKFFALTLVALLSLTMVLAAVGCGGGQQAEEPATESAPADQSMMQDTSSMMADTSAMMADTTMQH